MSLISGATAAGLQPEAREFYLRALLTLAGLRGLEQLVDEEARNMPVLIDILENKVLGREFKKGQEQGLHEGRQQEACSFLRRLLQKRFGPIPTWAEENLASRSASELEELGVRLLEVGSIEELLN